MAIKNILTDQWNGEPYGDVREGIIAKLNEIIDSVNRATGKGVDALRLELNEGNLYVTLTLTDETQVAKSVPLTGIIEGLAQVNSRTGNIDYSLLPHQVLASMGRDIDGDTVSLDLYDSYYYDPSSRLIRYRLNPNVSSVEAGEPSKGVVYYNAVNGKYYRWLGTAREPWEELKPNIDPTALEEILNSDEFTGLFADIDGLDTLVYGKHALVLPLASMGSAWDNVDGDMFTYVPKNGDYYYHQDPRNNVYEIVFHGGEDYIRETPRFAPNGRTLYLNLHTGRTYLWNETGKTFVETKLGSGGAGGAGVALASMGNALDSVLLPEGAGTQYEPAEGDAYYEPRTGKLVHVTSGGTTTESDPRIGQIYCNAKTRLLYYWDGSGMVPAAESSTYARWKRYKQEHSEAVVNQDTWLSRLGVETYSKDDIDDIISKLQTGELIVVQGEGDMYIVDSHESDSVLMAASARQTKWLYTALKRLWDNLAPLAFIGAKPNLEDIDIPLTTYTMDTSGLVNVYVYSGGTVFEQGKPADIWLAARDGYTLVAADAAETSVTDMEGNALTLAVSPTYDSTTHRIHFKIASVNQSFKVVCEATSEALNVALNGSESYHHLRISPTDAESGETYSGVLEVIASYAVSHRLPDSIQVSEDTGDVQAYVDDERIDYDPETGDLEVTEVAGDLIVYAVAVEKSKYGFTLNGFTQENVTIKRVNPGTAIESNVSDLSLLKVYEDEPFMLKFYPNEGFTLDITAVTGASLTPESDGSFTVFSAAATGNVVITGSVEALAPHTVKLSIGEGVRVIRNGVEVQQQGTAPVQHSVYHGSPYLLSIAARDNYTLSSVEVLLVTATEQAGRITYDYEDVTSQCYSNGEINIPSVTDDYQITLRAIANEESGFVTLDTGGCRNVKLTHYVDGVELPSGISTIPEGSSYRCVVEEVSTAMYRRTTDTQPVANTNNDDATNGHYFITTNGVSVIMGGNDITSQSGVWNGTSKEINIGSVSGDLEIAVIAESRYRPNTGLSNLAGGNVQNYAEGVVVNMCINYLYLPLHQEANFLVWKPGPLTQGFENVYNLHIYGFAGNVPHSHPQYGGAVYKRTDCTFDSTLDAYLAKIGEPEPNFSQQIRYTRATFTTSELANCYLKAYKLRNVDAADPLAAENIEQEWIIFDGAYSLPIE